MMAAKAGFHDVLAVHSGERALEILKDSDGAFDCMLLDINMPGIDGIDLCRMIRGMPEYTKTPIIMLTAMSDKDYVDRAFKAGATDYANKPFDIVELRARLSMAEHVVKARRETLTALPAADVEGKEPSTPHTFQLSDEIEIKGIDDAVEYGALANYLTQLSHSGIISSQVFAVKIDQAQAIYNRATPDEFAYAITEVAESIHETLRANGYLMAYAGGGVFVVISNKATLESSVELESQIQHMIDDKNIEFDTGEPIVLDVSIGNPIRPNASKNQRVRKTFDRAIARAESRVQKKHGDQPRVNIRLLGN